MSANKKKAKRRKAKALQNLRKTPEKAISSITETEKSIIRSYGLSDDPDDEVIIYKPKLTEYGLRLIEHYAKVGSGINDPDFVFDEDEDYEDEDYEDEDYEDEDYEDEDYEDEDYEDENYDDDAFCPHCGSPMIRINIQKDELL